MDCGINLVIIMDMLIIIVVISKIFCWLILLVNGVRNIVFSVILINVVFRIQFFFVVEIFQFVVRDGMVIDIVIILKLLIMFNINVIVNMMYWVIEIGVLFM